MSFQWLFKPAPSTALPAARTATAAQKLMMLCSAAVCRLVLGHFILRQATGREIDAAALADLSDRLGRIAHEQARKVMQ